MTNIFVDRHIIVYLYCIWLWLYVNVGILIMFYKCIHISPQNLLQIIEFGAFSPHLMFIQTKRHHWKDFLLGSMMSIFISLSINFKPFRIICRLQVQFHTVLSPMCWVSSDQDYLRQSLYFRGEETKTQGGPWSPLCQWERARGSGIVLPSPYEKLICFKVKQIWVQTVWNPKQVSWL